MKEKKESYQYKILFEVGVFHAFYTSGDCPNLVVYPTHSTQQVMNDLSLMLKTTPSGFLILYDERIQSTLIDYINRNGIWSRLSFIVLSSTPYFINLTELPMDMLNRTLYLSNTIAHKQAKHIVLHPGNYEEGAQAVKVIRKSLIVDIPDDGAFYIIELIDVSKQIVASKNSKEYKGVFTFYFELSQFPEGLYELVIKKENKNVTKKESFVCVAAIEPSIVFLDILLTDPTGSAPDNFPIAGKEVTDRHYRINFKNRSTSWRYFVVPADQRNGDDLRIRSVDHDFEFEGPHQVDIGNGTIAYQFTSEREIPLKEQSPYKFKLLKVRPSKSNEEILNRLPVAGITQVWPIDSKTYSTIYVNV